MTHNKIKVRKIKTEQSNLIKNKVNRMGTKMMKKIRKKRKIVMKRREVNKRKRRFRKYR